MSKIDYVDFSICAHCAKPSIWVQTHLVYPEDASATPLPHEEMPHDVAVDFNEASGDRRLVTTRRFGVAAARPPEAVQELGRAG
jgi:hypothetical protein